MKALLFINHHKEGAKSLAEKIREKLKASGMEAEEASDCIDTEALDAYALAICLGGDGTVLRAARMVAPLGIPIFAVNLGSVGFLAAIEPKSWEAMLAKALKGEALISSRMMLQVSVLREEEKSFVTIVSRICLNEVVVSAAGMAKLLRFSVNIPGVADFSYRADGLIAATATGSTAYSCAAGGSILDPELDAVILNPICPFSLASRAIVLPLKEEIAISLDSEQRNSGSPGTANLTLDGQLTFPLEPGDRVVIKAARERALLVGADRSNFYRALGTKLFKSREVRQNA